MRPWRRLLREPLLHFVLFGALVVGLDTLGWVAPVADDMVIHVTPGVLARLHHEHESTFGRAPSQQELDEAVMQWTDVEMLVLEAVVWDWTGLIRVRTRLAERMAYVMAALEVLPSPPRRSCRRPMKPTSTGMCSRPATPCGSCTWRVWRRRLGRRRRP